MSRRTFGRRFQSARTDLGLTQQDVAERSGVTAKYVSQIENDRASPTIAVVIRLVEQGLEMTMAGFFADDEAAARDDIGRLRVLLSGESPAVRRRALRVIRALLDD